MLLIVDDDKLTRKLLRHVLEQAGYEVESAEDGAQALKVARARTPTLVITDILMPIMDGFTFVKELRAEARLALVPVIFLSHQHKAANRLLGFKLGADDFLPKPVYGEELKLRVANVLKRSQTQRTELDRKLTAGPTAKRGFSGELEHLGVSALLTVLQLECKTGVLHVDDGALRCQLSLRDGRVVSACIEKPVRVEGREVIYRMLKCRSGHFAFDAREVPEEDTIAAPTTQLLLEAAHRMDQSGEQRGLAAP